MFYVRSSHLFLIFIVLTVLTACGGNGSDATSGIDHSKGTPGRWENETKWGAGDFSGLPADVINNVMKEYDDIPPPQPSAWQFSPNDGSVVCSLGDDPDHNIDDPDGGCEYFLAYCDGELKKSPQVSNYPQGTFSCLNKDGELNGYKRAYAPYGFLSWVDYYRDGVLVGPRLIYRDGIYEKELDFDRNGADYGDNLGLVSQTFLYSFEFVNASGELHGPKLTYWPYRNYGERPIKTAAFYINGKLEGKAVEYWPNGKLKSEANYVNGVCEGDYFQYFPNGELRLKTQCSADILTGSAEIYTAVAWKDGVLNNFKDEDYIPYGLHGRLCQLYPFLGTCNDNIGSYKYRVVQKVVSTFSDTVLSVDPEQQPGRDPRLPELHGDYARYEIITRATMDVDPAASENQVLVEQAQLVHGKFTGPFKRWIRTAEDSVSKVLWREGTYNSDSPNYLYEYDETGALVYEGEFSDPDYSVLKGGFGLGDYYDWDMKFVPIVNPVPRQGDSFTISVSNSAGDYEPVTFAFDNGLLPAFTGSQYSVLPREVWYEKLFKGSVPETITVSVDRSGSLASKPMSLLGAREGVIGLGVASSADIDVDEESRLVLAVDDSDNIIFIGKAGVDTNTALSASTTTQFLLETYPGIQTIIGNYGFAELLVLVPEVQSLLTLIEDRTQNSASSWSDPADTAVIDAIGGAVNGLYAYEQSQFEKASGTVAAKSYGTNYIVSPPETSKSGVRVDADTLLNGGLNLMVFNNRKRWLSLYVDGQSYPGMLKPNSKYMDLLFGAYPDGAKVEVYGLGKGDLTQYDSDRWLPPVVADFALNYAFPIVGGFTGSKSCLKAYFAPDGRAGWAGYLAGVSADPNFVASIRAEKYSESVIYAGKVMIEYLGKQILNGTVGCIGKTYARAAFKRLARYLVPSWGSVALGWDLLNIGVDIVPAFRDAAKSNLYESWDVINSDLQQFVGTWQADFNITDSGITGLDCDTAFTEFEHTFSISGNTNYPFSWNGRNGERNEDINAWGFPWVGGANMASYIFGSLSGFDGKLNMYLSFTGGAIPIIHQLDGYIVSPTELAGNFTAFYGNNFTGDGVYCEASFTARKISEVPADLPEDFPVSTN